MAGRPAIAQRPVRPIEDNPVARKGARREGLQGFGGDEDESEDAMDNEDKEDGDDSAEDGQQAKTIRPPMSRRDKRLKTAG